jgi:hypothetical protein
METYDAVAQELDEMQADTTSPGLAAIARSLAGTLDSTTNGTSAANVARELRMVMETVRALAPVRSHNDKLDELNRKRAERRQREQSA